jgi:hypothetical protein
MGIRKHFGCKYNIFKLNNHKNTIFFINHTFRSNKSKHPPLKKGEGQRELVIKKTSTFLNTATSGILEF